SKQAVHTLAVGAADTFGNTSSKTVTFTIDRTAPVTTITSPASDAVVGGSSVPVAASVTDALSGPDRADFYLCDVDCELLPSASSFAAEWDTTGLSDGDYVLKATGFDQAGNSQGSPSVPVTVDNTAPDVSVAGVSDGDVTNAAFVTPTFSASDPHL